MNEPQQSSNHYNQVEELVKKAVEADKSDDALKYSQAALNAANAFRLPVN